MEKIKLKVNIKTETPFNIDSGIQDGGFIKSITIKDINNRPYIPASTIKGKLRDNYRMIKGKKETDEIFGSENTSNINRIMIDNFYLVDKKYYSSIRYGIAMNRYRKVTEDAALYSKEVISGEFEGMIEFINKSNKKVKEDIILALKMITSIGGGKSKGFGRVNISVVEVNE